ncbi:MAG: efflux RND transporter permease subunit [Candidatus Goldiibacteriota bacterium]|jgi:HAE1 family hydrophobic/amphiphilic exporter-1
MNIAEMAIKRPIFVIMIVASIITLGLIGYTSMGVDMLPDIEYPTISVTTVYAGASAEEIENLVTKPLEDALAVVEGLDTLSSTSDESVSVITAKFNLGADVKYAETRVRDAVNKAKWKLPDDAKEPSVERFSAAEWIPVIAMTVKGNRDLAGLKEIVDDSIKPEIEKIKGVGRVDLWGGRDRAVKITINKSALFARMISFNQVIEAIDRENLNIPAGSIENTKRSIDVRVKGRFDSIPEIENVSMKAANGAIVRIKDIANVTFGLKDEERRTRVDGENGLIFGVYKQSGENSVEIARIVKSKMKDINAKLPPGIRFDVFRDPTHYVEQSIEGLQGDILIGALCAIIIVWLFLGSFRSTIITAIALPNSLLGAFFFINAAGFTINMMVLLALSLSIGLLIDDSIVVRENIFRYIEGGMDPKKAAVKGTNEVALAVIATTASIMAVFIPISFLHGVVGQFFKQFGFTIAFALTISLIDAFTTAPMLSAYWWKKEDSGKNTKGASSVFHAIHEKWEEIYEGIKEVYTQLLNWALDHKKSVIFGTLGLLAVSGLAVMFIGVAFMPDSDYSEIEYTIECRPDATIDVVDAKLKMVEAYLKTVPDIEEYYVVAGGEGSRGTASKNVGSIFARIKKGGRKSTPAGLEEYKKISAIIGKDALLILQDSGSGQVLSGGGDTFAITINITGDDIKVIDSIADSIKKEAEKTPGVADLDTSFRPGKPEISVKVDRLKASKLGLSTYEIGEILNMLINGKEIAQYRKGEKEYPIIMQLPENERQEINSLNDIMLTNSAGLKIPLSAVARFEFGSGPVEIKRENKKRIVKVTGNVREKYSLGDVVNALKKNIKQNVKIPYGYDYSFGGQASQLNDTITEMGTAMLLALLFMYMILASLYNSLVQPLILMISVPLAIIGAFLALLVTGQQLDLMAMIGILMVLGLVAKNGILLIDFTNQKIAQGMSAREALTHAGPIRLRPILMTTFAMIFGMLPLAFGFGESVIMAKTMPIAVIGGLLTSTFLTLIVIPVVYEWVERRKVKKGKALKYKK